MITLEKYNAKRNFSNTPEPKGAGKKTNQSRFVVQRHDASHLHYDFRLELGGVLKSWAVPKGPSLNPKTKRLAVQVEDHPVNYIHFEGKIPEGNYGAGTVEVWDKGSFTAVDGKGHKLSDAKAVEAIENGEIKFVVDGDKLQGGFVLVRLKDGKQKNWLLIKHRDAFASENEFDERPSKANPKKVGTQLKKKTAARERDQSPVQVADKKVRDPIKPMLASSTENAFDDDNWIFELKLDGYRAIAEVNKRSVKFYSRNGLSFASHYPTIVEALKKLKKPAVLDGEVVLLVDNKPDFQRLQHYEGNKQYPLVYYVFDILSLEGKSLKNKPLIDRKKILKKFLGKNSILRYADHIEGQGEEFFKKIKAQKIEGIVAKKMDSAYREGVRTKEWLKIKHQQTQEAVIAGYTKPRGSRKHFGALVLGEYKSEQLTYIGHTGTGFTDDALRELWKIMQPLQTKESPFAEKVKMNAEVTWIRPDLVCEIAFSEITQGNIRRHPVYLNLRPDKDAEEVTATAQTPVKKSATKRASAGKTTVRKVAAKKKAAKKDATPGNDHDEKDKTVKIGKAQVALTNLNKVYWPDEGITKGQMIDYYNSISTWILPYLKNRPMSLKRNPNGINDPGFYHKDAGEHAPRWMKTANIRSDAANKIIHYLLCNDKAALLYLANLGCIEMNPWNSTTKDLEKPDYLVMDIDPSDDNSFDEVIECALAVKSILDKAGAENYCKTSGATGLHIYVPMGAKYDYEQVKEFAHLIAIFAQALLPDTTSLERNLRKRGSKIYIDYLQNRTGQTLASAYSLRPRTGATVSTPLEWKEVKEGLHPSQFTMFNIEKRLQSKGDLFLPVLKKGINLDKCLKKLEG